MTDENLPTVPPHEADPKAYYKSVCYHEAGHAVVAWNFDLQIYEVVVNAANLSGHVQSFDTPDTKQGRIGTILCCCAGGVAHRCYQSGTGKGEILCSEVDYRLALGEIRALQNVPAGAELYLMRYFLTKTQQLVDVPEVRAQIQLLARHLLTTGSLRFGQVHHILKNAPTSKRAILQCCKMARQIETEWKPIVEKASAMAPQLAATEAYKEYCLLP